VKEVIVVEFETVRGSKPTKKTRRKYKDKLGYKGNWVAKGWAIFDVSGLPFILRAMALLQCVVTLSGWFISFCNAGTGDC
jgi:hypothetical protein